MDKPEELRLDEFGREIRPESSSSRSWSRSDYESHHRDHHRSSSRPDYRASDLKRRKEEHWDDLHRDDRREDDQRERALRKQCREFFEDNKNTEFLKEKYHPEYIERSWQEKILNANRAALEFKENLDSAKHNFSIKSLPDYFNKNQSNKNEEQNTSLDKEPSAVVKTESTGIEAPHPETVKSNETEESGEKKESKEKKAQEEEATKKSEVNESETTNSTKKDSMSGEQKIESAPPKEGKSEQGEGESQLIETPPEGNVLFIKNIDHFTKRSELLSLFSSTEGFERLSISDPIMKKDFFRVGWVYYDSSPNCHKALTTLNLHQLRKDSEPLQLSLDTKKSVQQIVPAIAAEQKTMENHLKLALQLAKLFDSEKKLTEENRLNTYWKETGTTESDLDVVLAYLRLVHNYCFYCAEEFEGADELNRKCGETHVRNDPEASLMDPEEQIQTVLSLEKKLHARLDHPIEFDSLFGTKMKDNMRSDFFRNQVLYLEKEKFRCNLCTKLFRGDEFVRKHILNRHTDKLEKLNDEAIEAQYLKNYLADCNKTGFWYSGSTSNSRQLSSSRPSRGRWSGSGSGYKPNPRGGGARFSHSPQHSAPRGSKPRGGARISGGFEMPIQDPRGLRSYDDLDAPADDIPSFEY